MRNGPCRETGLRRLIIGFFMLFLSLASCTAEAWNNPHGLLGGLFSSSPNQSSQTSPVIPKSSPGTPPQTNSAGGSQSSFGKLDPPTFSHVIPFPEGDGIYLQWRRVDNVTDYLVYNGNRLIKDVTVNRTTITGLLPCTQYMLRIYSSDGTKVSENGLLVRVHTRGCLRTPR